MKKLKTLLATLLFAVVIAIGASSNVVALDFIYCEAPNGTVRAMSTTYASDCRSGLTTPGSWKINETRAKALFEEERRRALGIEQASPLATAKTVISPLVDDFYVWTHTGKPDVVFLDVGGEGTGRTKADYLAAHIPGAIYTDYKKDGWRITDQFGTPGMLPLDEIKALETLIGKLGVNNNTQVVIATAGKTAKDLAAGTRIYWTFKVLGHDGVSILNGGMAGYSEEKIFSTQLSVNYLASGDVKPVNTRFEAWVQPELIATKKDMRDALVKDWITVDNRPRGEYAGVILHQAVARAGTMHHAKNLPYTWLVREGSVNFRKRENLLKLYDQAGIPTTGNQINFCNTGHEATLGWFVSYELLGNKQAKVYDGSMAEWAADRNMPMMPRVYVH